MCTPSLMCKCPFRQRVSFAPGDGVAYGPAQAPTGDAHPMRRATRSSIEDLRLTIDCLPVHTRVAMLQGISANEIIVGAYSDRKGGVCPMLAAHRLGGRTNPPRLPAPWPPLRAHQGPTPGDRPRAPRPALPARGKPPRR